MQNEITTQHLSKQQLLSILKDCYGLVDEFGSIWHFDSLYSNDKETSFVLSTQSDPQFFYFCFDGAILNGYFLTLKCVDEDNEILGPCPDFTIVKAHIPTV